MADVEAAFGDLLKRIRLGAGLSQEELADRAGVSARAISDLERGERLRPRRETLGLLFNALQVTTEERAQLEDSVRARPGHGAAPTVRRGTYRDAGPFRSTSRGYLPSPPTPLVARDRELKQATALLFGSQVRLLTLSGPGGCGKTRLALELAHRSVGLFPNGVHFVDLSAIGDSSQVLPAIAQTLQVPESRHESLLDTLLCHLEANQLLLVLDNFEHVLDAGLAIASLLSGCPRIKILATSREALHLRAEVEFLVSPLDLPDLGDSCDPQELAACPSVAFFVEMVRRLDQTFQPEGASLRAVAELCVRLDGLPLALELAAARVRTLTLDALLDRCAGTDLLGGTIRDLPSRQRTLKASLDWSYGLLTREQQQWFRRLAAFEGEFDIGAAESVSGLWAGAGQGGALNALEGLVEKNLIRRQSSTSGDPHYSMLRTARQYALERLEERGELHGVCRTGSASQPDS